MIFMIMIIMITVLLKYFWKINLVLLGSLFSLASTSPKSHLFATWNTPYIRAHFCIAVNNAHTKNWTHKSFERYHVSLALSSVLWELTTITGVSLKSGLPWYKITIIIIKGGVAVTKAVKILALPRLAWPPLPAPPILALWWISRQKARKCDSRQLTTKRVN